MSQSIPPKNHTSRFVELAKSAKARVKEITIAELKTKIANNEHFYLIDVREANEYAAGYIPNALPLSKGIIERDIEKYIPDSNATIMLYCGGGFRSALAADNLQKMGYTNVYSVDGGFTAWVNEGNVIKKPG